MSKVTEQTTAVTPSTSTKKKAPGLTFPRYFTKPGVSPYDELEWELRTAQITDAQGGKHDWRIDLINKLVALQKEDGSWKGTDRFMESNQLLVTCYATLALEEAMADMKEHPAKN